MDTEEFFFKAQDKWIPIGTIRQNVRVDSGPNLVVLDNYAPIEHCQLSQRALKLWLIPYFVMSYCTDTACQQFYLCDMIL